jgi:hypothetical protein
LYVLVHKEKCLQGDEDILHRLCTGLSMLWLLSDTDTGEFQLNTQVYVDESVLITNTSRESICTADWRDPAEVEAEVPLLSAALFFFWELATYALVLAS